MCIACYGIVYVGFPPQTFHMPISSSTVALVTGGSRGIGFATAAALVARGASVAITGTDEQRLEEARLALAGTDAAARVLAVAGRRPRRGRR